MMLDVGGSDLDFVTKPSLVPSRCRAPTAPPKARHLANATGLTPSLASQLLVKRCSVDAPCTRCVVTADVIASISGYYDSRRSSSVTIWSIAVRPAAFNESLPAATTTSETSAFARPIS